MIRHAVLAAGVVLALAGCTTTSGDTAPRESSPHTSRLASPTASPTPVASGPTSSVDSASCPFVAKAFVHRTMGMRLGRLTVQRSRGRAVGCRFYALQGGPLHHSEHLPGRNQPAVEITTARFADTTDAHNAFVLQAEQGTNLTQAALSSDAVGVCFQDDFDPHDRGRDYACAANSGSTEILVRSVDTTGTFNTVAVTRMVLRAVPA